MKKNSFLKDKKAIFIGTSIMLEKCIEFSLKKFKNIYVLTDDKKIIKKLKNKINLVNIKDLKKINFDYLFSILNHRIIPYKVLKNAKQTCLNFHDGPLPRYAGLFSSSWAIINNEKTHGVTWHKITKKIDAGDIVASKKFKIKKNDTSYSLDIRSILIGIKLFKTLIKKIDKNSFSSKKQNLRKRTYFGKNEIKRLIKEYNLKKENNSLTRALTLSPQKNYLIEKLVGKKINISNKIMTSKKDKSKSYQNKNFIKLIDLLGKVINFNFKINKVDDSKLEEMSLNNHPKWDSLAHVKLLSVIEKKFKVTINEANIDKFSNIKSIFNFLSKKGKLNQLN